MKNEPKTLTTTLSVGAKIGKLIEHLQSGQELNIGGRTYVWLDNYVIREEMDDQGKIQCYGLDGLAIKGQKQVAGQSSDYYIGQSDIELSQFIHLANHVTEEDWLNICASAALRGMLKQR